MVLTLKVHVFQVNNPSKFANSSFSAIINLIFSQAVFKNVYKQESLSPCTIFTNQKKSNGYEITINGFQVRKINKK